MLPKKNRLPAFVFRRIYQKGNTQKGEFVVLKSIPNKKSFSRFGFVVSAKVVKKATKRNLLRRRASEIIKSHLGKVKTGFDFAFIFKKNIEFKDQEQEFKKLLDV